MTRSSTLGKSHLFKNRAFFFCSQVSQQENEQLLKCALNFALVLLHIIFCEQLVKVIKSLNFVISQLIFVNFFS